MIDRLVEEAVEGNYSEFAELFKQELNSRLHEAIEAKKQSVIDATHNVCESCDPDEDEDEEEYFDVDEDDVYDEEEIEEGYYGNPKKMKKESDNPVDRIQGNPYGPLRPKGIGSRMKMKKEMLYGSKHSKKMKAEQYGKDDHTMDPKSHVKKDKEGMFVVYHKNGKAVEKFDNKKEADAYAMKNHDDLMKENMMLAPKGMGRKSAKALYKKEAYHSKKKKMEAMDPVGQEDGDIDNDGDKDSSDKYLMKRRKAIAKAMKKEAIHKKSKSGGGY